MNLGKPNRRLMAGIVCRLTGARARDRLVSPSPGVDTAVLGLNGRRVLVASTDPISLIPSLGPARSAWLSVHATASDIATSGIRPRYAMFDLNLPPTMTDKLFTKYWIAIHTACRQLGISILGGHTGRFQGCDYTIMGGVTMFGIGDRKRYVTSAMARNGDDIIATKSAAIEATAVLAFAFPRTLRKALGGQTLAAARALMKKVSVVDDALWAASIGLRDNGVTAMHDVTEGGVLSAVLELGDSSGLKVLVDSESIPVVDEVREVCNFFRIDPLVSLGQGCLLLTSRPHKTREITRRLRSGGIESVIIGKMTMNRVHSITRHGVRRLLDYPRTDPYWKAYWRSVRKGLQ